MKMIDAVDESGNNYGKEGKNMDSLTEKLALVMARSAAVNYKRKLTAEEMEHIVSQLFALPDPSFTPNGSKIFMLIDQNYLGSVFK